MSTTSKYFQKEESSSKRKQPSSNSSVSDCSPDSYSAAVRQSKKKTRTLSQEDPFETDMSVKESLEEIKKTLANMPTKEDLASLKNEMREEMDKVCAALSKRVDVLESSVFDLQSKNDRISLELSNMEKENKDLRDKIQVVERGSCNIKRMLNESEQHGRSWNARVFGVKEKRGETAEDCEALCLNIFKEKLGLQVTTADIDVAHRAGKEGQNGKPRPILLRFTSRKQRGKVLAARRQLKGTGLAIAEDLTAANYRVLKAASEHLASLSVWSSNGKTLARMKSGGIVRVDTDTDINSLFQREMRGSSA